VEIINCGEVVAMTQSMTIWATDGTPLGILEVDRFVRMVTVIRGYRFFPFNADAQALRDGFQTISDDTLLNAIATIEDNDGDWAKGRPRVMAGSEGDFIRIEPGPLVTSRINQDIYPGNGSRKSLVVEVSFYDRVEFGIGGLN